MGLVPNLSLTYKNQHKVNQAFLMRKLPYTKRDVGLSKTQLSSSSYYDGWA